MRKLVLVLIIFLLFICPVLSLKINEPRDSYTYYQNLVDFDITWDIDTETCKYNLNSQTNKTFGCQNTFIIDIPYNSGIANITLYGLNASNEVNNASVSISINDSPDTAKGLVALGAIIFAVLLPFFFMIISLGVGLIETEPNEHITLRMIFILLSLASWFPAYNVVNIAIRQYIHIDIFSDALNPFIYGWIFIITIFYIFMYIIYKSITMNDTRRHKTGRYE